jgi:hypothetical protein
MMDGAATDGVLPLDRALATAAVDAGAARYFAERRARVGPFVDRHFSLGGTLRLHRAALGWDIVKAPANLTLAAPAVMAKVASRGAARLGAGGLARLLNRKLLFETAVGREVSWLICTKLLELPMQQGTRVATRDALAEAILADPGIERAIAAALAEIGAHADDPVFRARLKAAMAEYAVSRAAGSEIATGLMTLGVGALALHKLTPGAVSLGPTLAGIMAQQAAVASFPLGGWLGGVWYGWFPAAPTAGLIATTTGSLMLAATVFAAFAGVLADPVQRATGLHRARLLRLIRTLERQFNDQHAPGFVAHDQYVARLLDLFDLIGAALRIART